MNRNKIKGVGNFLTAAFSVKTFQNFTGQSVIFPFYHLISENTPSYIKHLYKGITPEQFKSDLDFLLKHFDPGQLKDLPSYISNGKKAKKPQFYLSFDDGLTECYEIVYPILKQKGIEAIFFINPGYIENDELFYRFKTSLIREKITKGNYNLIVDYFDLNSHDIQVVNKKILSLSFSDVEAINEVANILEIDFKELKKSTNPYMSLEQINELHKNGFLVGSHSLNHPLFAEISKEEQIQQIKKSAEFVKKHFNPKLSVFAFPFTDFGVHPDVFEYIENNENIDITFGTAGLKNDGCKKHIQRIPMDEFQYAGARQIIRNEYSYYLLKMFFGKNHIKR